jgi:hypothetical protein
MLGTNSMVENGFIIKTSSSTSTPTSTPTPGLTPISTSVFSLKPLVFSTPDSDLLPAFEPVGGIFTSPLTMYNSLKLDDLVVRISQVLDVLKMKFIFDNKYFKWYVVTHLTSGYARFYVRIWRRVQGDFSVEVMRERGSNILVTRVFDVLCDFIEIPNSNDITDAFHVVKKSCATDIFDFSPSKLSDEILATFPKSSAKDIKAFIKTIILIIKSRRDDVSINGCVSVAKFATQSDAMRDDMAKSRKMVKALSRVVFGSYSIDTRTMAALALSVLANSIYFIFVVKDLIQMKNMVNKEMLAKELVLNVYEVHNFSHYCSQIIENIEKHLYTNAI